MGVTPDKKYLFVFEQHKEENRSSNEVYMSVYCVNNGDVKPYKMNANISELFK
jgi:hypothetical protein